MFLFLFPYSILLHAYHVPRNAFVFEKKNRVVLGGHGTTHNANTFSKS